MTAAPCGIAALRVRSVTFAEETYIAASGINLRLGRGRFYTEALVCDDTRTRWHSLPGCVLFAEEADVAGLNARLVSSR